MNKRIKIQFIFVLLVNLAALIVSLFLTWAIFSKFLGRIVLNRGEVLNYCVVQLVAFLVATSFFKQKRNIISLRWHDFISNSIKFNSIMLVVVAFLLLITKNPAMNSRYMLVGVHLFNLVLQPIANRLLKGYLHNHQMDAHFISLVGVVTTRSRAKYIIDDFADGWDSRVVGLAILDAAPEEIGQEYCGVEIKAGFEDFIEWIRREALDEVYMDIPADSGRSLMPYLREIESMGVTVHLALGILTALDERGNAQWSPHLSKTITRRAGTPVVTLEAVRIEVEGSFAKRLMDIAGALVGSVLALIAMALVAIPLKLESPGPLLFKQKRVGLNGRIFSIYKIRSMYIDAEERKKELMDQNEMNGLMFKMEDDPRITRVGRFIRRTSIDELPQFFNVLRGDMSLVGTRPPTLDEYEQYESHHKRRLSMKPGITGMWQVSGRSNIENFEDVVRLDVEYIDNWSIWLDIKLLFKTVLVVFTGKGAE